MLIPAFWKAMTEPRLPWGGVPPCLKPVRCTRSPESVPAFSRARMLLRRLLIAACGVGVKGCGRLKG